MDLDEEIRELITGRNIAADIVPYDEITGVLEAAYDWGGSKICWDRTANHIHARYDITDPLTGVRRFLEHETILQSLRASRRIFYVNDGPLDFGLALSPESFFDAVPLLVENVPLHQYFYDEDAAWCLVVAAEGDIDFGHAIRSLR